MCVRILKKNGKELNTALLPKVFFIQEYAQDLQIEDFVHQRK